jgi:hypothetical protein
MGFVGIGDSIPFLTDISSGGFVSQSKSKVKNVFLGAPNNPTPAKSWNSDATGGLFTRAVAVTRLYGS